MRRFSAAPCWRPDAATGPNPGPNSSTSRVIRPRYYASLRDYKNSDHARYFGWYAGWVGTGARMSNSLRGLPDSLDIVSLWENQTNLDRNRMEDMRYVQQVKGTKVLFTFIVRNCGDGCTPAEHAGSVEEKSAFWGFVENDDAAREAACRKYANAVCDSLFKYGYDGFDIDFEPSYGYSGNIAMKASVDPKPMLWFVGELSKRIGPLSGSGKMLVIDGETWSSPAELAPVYDYIIEQAYEAREPEDLQDRFDRYIKHFSPHRDAEELARIWFVTENFEKHRGTGGVAYVEQDGTTMNSLLGMAAGIRRSTAAQCAKAAAASTASKPNMRSTPVREPFRGRARRCRR